VGVLTKIQRALGIEMGRDVMGARSGFQDFLNKVMPLQSLNTCPVLASGASCGALVRASLEKGLVNESTKSWTGVISHGEKGGCSIKGVLLCLWLLRKTSKHDLEEGF